MKKLMKLVLSFMLAFTLTCTNTKAQNYVYVLMNVPYSAIYQQLNNDVPVDQVSRATKYSNNAYVVDGSVLGVKMPVQLSEEDYELVKEKVTDESSLYYIYETIESPVTYIQATYDSDYHFNSLVSTKSVTQVDGKITSNTKWGDYVLELSDSTLGIAPAEYYGSYVTCSDGSEYAFRDGENTWSPRGYFEFGWATTEGYKDVKGFNRAYSHYASMEGKSITTLTYITSTGIKEYQFSTPLYVPTHLEEDIQCEIAGSTLLLSNLPELKNAKVNLYTDGRTPTYYIQNADLTSSIQFDTSVLEDGKEYNVSITNDEYVTIVKKVTYQQDNAIVYVNMNVSFQSFYNSYDLHNDVKVDSVSSATTNKVQRFSNVYYGNTPAIENGTEVLGVIVPARMSSHTYALLQQQNLTVNDEFYTYDLVEEVPSTFIPVNMTDQVQLGKLETITKTNIQASATLTSTTNWGDYQINLVDSALGVPSSDVYGVVLTLDTGNQYALRQGENLWTLNNIYEFAFSTGIKTTEPHGCMLKGAHYASMEGHSITSITYLTTDGKIQYTLAKPLYVLPHATNHLEANFFDENTVEIQGIMEDFTDVKISVYTGTRQRTYLVENAIIENGKVRLEKQPEIDTLYTVLVESSNYASMSVQIEYKKQETVIPEDHPQITPPGQTDSSTPTPVIPNVGLVHSSTFLIVAVSSLAAGIIVYKKKEEI